MKTANEIFLTLGVPIQACGTNRYRGFRAFNEHDITKIQEEALKAGVELGRKDEREAALIRKLPEISRE